MAYQGNGLASLGSGENPPTALGGEKAVCERQLTHKKHKKKRTPRII
jgi:hypothetical protein